MVLAVALYGAGELGPAVVTSLQRYFYPLVTSELVG